MRNKIYLSKIIPDSQYEQYIFIDIGKILSTSYKEKSKVFLQESKFDAHCFFRSLLQAAFTEDKTRIVFSNIGILLEKDFALDVPRFLLEFAKDYQVFVLQEDFRIEGGNTLVWNVENPKDKIEFSQGVLEVLND